MKSKGKNKRKPKPVMHGQQKVADVALGPYGKRKGKGATR